MTTKNLTPYLLLAATTLIVTPLLLVSCTSAEDSAETSFTPTESQPVAFGAYLNRATTRGGTPGELTTDGTSGTKSLQTLGFGVFGYYTNDAPYSFTALPNFMYNQQVTSTDGTNWTYSPVKYWPNEKGTGENKVGADRLSFFAYAPYVEVNSATGQPTADPKDKGIVALTRVNESGDPYVRYYASMKPSECVDLCWAAPSIDETKPAVNSKVNFVFKHALASLNVQIDADIDDVRDGSSDHGKERDANTRIYVRSITFTGFATKGQLNLNNSGATAVWNNLECDCDVTSDPITIHDGRWDEQEGVAASLNEKPTGLNPVIVQSGPYTAASTPSLSLTSTTDGVTNTAANLFDPADITGDDEAKKAAPIYVIPTNLPMKVTIVYDVETYDPKLVTNFLSDGVTNGTSIQNTITADIKTAGDAPAAITMEAGKKYTINLHLGMTSVKVTASVAEWDTTSPASVDIDLPNNQ